MSATIDTRIFSEYFFTLVKGDKYPAFPIDISEKRKYSVILSYLDGILNGVPEVSEIIFFLPNLLTNVLIFCVHIIDYFTMWPHCFCKNFVDSHQFFNNWLYVFL